VSGPYQFLPPLSDAEYDALRADIAANGMRHPVIVDEKGKILDGHHRARIAGELGFKPERETVAGLTEEEKRDLAFTLNSARRHLDAAGRRAAVVASLKADPQLSDRQHARRTGVSHPTVAGIRAELVAAGRLESFTSRVGAGGRTRPATQPSSPTGSETAPIADLPQEPDRSGSTAAEVESSPSADGTETDFGVTVEPALPGVGPVDGESVPAPAAVPGGAAAGVTPDDWSQQLRDRVALVHEFMTVDFPADAFAAATESDWAEVIDLIEQMAGYGKAIRSAYVSRMLEATR
jgi:ParB-like chromosome segregation protein Spo0J